MSKGVRVRVKGLDRIRVRIEVRGKDRRKDRRKGRRLTKIPGGGRGLSVRVRVTERFGLGFGCPKELGLELRV